jgi:hypothetical protein
MTLQTKVKSMQARMAELQKGCGRNDQKRHCFSLLHDAVLFTGPRIDELDDTSLVGYIELAAQIVTCPNPDFRKLRNALIQMGFNTAPAN